MPRIEDRLTLPETVKYSQIPSPNPEGIVPGRISLPAVDSPSSLAVSATSGNLMSINGGNSVPMRGILPVEQMSDCDLYRFFPYTPYFDRIPKYTYYTLLNTAS